MKILKQQQRVSLQKIEDEYAPDMFKDTEDQYLLKQAIDQLSDLDRAILIVYADEGSMAKTAVKFGVSPATIYSNIARIRTIIRKTYDK